jgi:hypothetical protein
MESSSSPPTSAPSFYAISNGLDNEDTTTSIPIVVHRPREIPRSNPVDSSPTSPPPPSTTIHPINDTHTHSLDLPWVTRDLNQSSAVALTPPSSPSHHSLSRRVSDINLSAHPSRHAHSRKNQARTACFVHSLLSTQSGHKGRSLSRTGSSDDLTRGSRVEALNKGPERRDRWNRGMTKKELSDMALGVRELSKRLG